MATHTLETKTTKFLAVEEAAVKSDFNTGEQEKDKDTGLPVYVISGVLAQEGRKTVLGSIKVASAVAPVVVPLTNYDLDGILSVTDYIPNGSSRSSYSYKLVGSLVAPGSGPKSFPKND